MERLPLLLITATYSSVKLIRFLAFKQTLPPPPPFPINVACVGLPSEDQHCLGGRGEGNEERMRVNRKVKIKKKTLSFVRDCLKIMKKINVSGHVMCYYCNVPGI